MELDFDKPIFVYYTSDINVGIDACKKMADAGMQVILVQLSSNSYTDGLDCVYGGKYHNRERDIHKIEQAILLGKDMDITKKLKELKKVLNRNMLIENILEE